MNVIPPGRSVIADFDGTLVRLAVPWAELRRTLSVTRIDDLWRDGDETRWDVVTEAEVAAARTAPAVDSVMRALTDVSSIAILTSNHERAVDVALARWPALQSRVRVVVGRVALGGPKSDFEVFARGYARCLDALGRPPLDDVAYVGDMAYELTFARDLGAEAFDVAEL